MAVLRYGIDRSIQLEFDEDAAPIVCDVPRGESVDDLGAALAAALDDPLDYPPLGKSTTPGDRVVLALDASLPCAAEVVSGVIDGLLRAGVHPDGIAVLQPHEPSDDADDPCRLLDSKLRELIGLFVHDPADRNRLAYLAANEADEPILLHRAIHDADLVLPIGRLRAESSAGYYGIHGAIFPNFADDATQRRFRSMAAWRAQGTRRGQSTRPGQGDARTRLVEEVDRVAWLLGINFTIQLIPGPGGAVMHVVAGQSDAVRRRGRKLYEDAWSLTATDQAGLVVVGIEGGPAEQTWQNVGRALEAAGALAEDGGSIAVCCDLADAPGPSMQMLAGAESPDAVLRRIRKERFADALPAAQLARAQDRGRVYLLSRLDAATVEELDVVHVAAPEELARLVRRHESCILLAGAPNAMIQSQQTPAAP